MKLFGDKKAYFSSLFAMIFSVIWSVVFFSIFLILLKEWLLPALVDFFPAIHVYLKDNIGGNYSDVLYVYFVYISALLSLFLGAKFGFRGSKQRRLIFSHFSDGKTDTKSAFIHHYKSYGILDLVCAAVVTLFLIMMKSRVSASFANLFPHVIIFEYLLSPSPAKNMLILAFGTLLLSVASVFGVYSSHRSWCADILYDLE